MSRTRTEKLTFKIIPFVVPDWETRDLIKHIKVYGTTAIVVC